MSTHRKPAAVPIRRAAPALIPAAVAGWVTLPEMRPIITLTAADARTAETFRAISRANRARRNRNSDSE